MFKASAPELPKAGGSKAAFPDNFSASGWEVKSVLCPALKRSKKNKTLGFPKDFVAELVPPPGLEPGASGLGATSFGSCLIVRRASKCPQTRMNTGFFIELPVAEYLKISPNIGSFCTQIEPAIRQILDRFLAVTPNTGDSLELSYPII